MKKKILLLIMIISAFSMFAQEQQSSGVVLIDSKTSETGKSGLKELSLDQAIDMAVRNNLGLQSSAIDLKKSKWSVVSLFNSYYPTLSLSGSLISSLLSEEDRTAKGASVVPYMPSATADPPVMLKEDGAVFDKVEGLVYEKVTPQWNANLDFGLQWNFNAAMIFNSYNTVLEYQSGKITYEDAVVSLEKNVKTFYYMLSLNKANYDIEVSKLASKKDRYDQAQTKFKNGLTPKLDVLSTRVDYESYKPTLQTLDNTIGYYQKMLQYYIGEELDENVILTDTFVVADKAVPDYDHAVKLFEKNNIQLKTLLLGKKQAKNALNIFIANMTPSFSLRMSVSPVVMDITENWFEDSNINKSSSLYLSLSLPLSDWLPLSSTQVSIIGSKYAMKKLDLNIENYMKSQKIQIRKSIDDISTAVENVKSMQMSVEMAQESYDETKKAYNLGTREILDVKDAENTLFAMKYQLLATEFSYRNSLLELETLLNSDLSDILPAAEDNNNQNTNIQ